MGMKAAIDLTPAQRRQVQALLERYLPETTVWAFGSRVTFKARPDSDLDLVAFTTPEQKSKVSVLKEAFEESDLPFRVDLLEWDDIPENFRNNIEGGEVSQVAWASSEQGSRPAPLAPASSSAPSERSAGSSAAPLGGFKEYSFLELLETIIDNRGRTCPVVDNEEDIPLIATNCVKNDNLYPVFENVRYVDQLTYDTWFRGHPEPGDMLFVCKGSPGRVCWVPDPVNFCIAQDMVAIRANRHLVYPKYLFALIRSEEVQAKIGNMHVGTLIPHFKKGDFGNLYLNIHNDFSTQRKIGDLYFTLSEKIALNRATNQTLEQIALALFKSWFVDFDPVHAKARGEQPVGMDAITAALFPDSFEESELGMIPKGWEVKSLDEIANFLNGLALQKFPAKEGANFLPVIKIAELKKGNSVGADRASTDVPGEYIIENGDVVFSWSGSLFVDIWCGGLGALNQHLFKVTSKHIPKWLYLAWVKHHLITFQQIAADKAVTMGHIKRSHLSEAMCCIPPKQLREKMNSSFSAILEKQIQLRLECNEIEQLRDSLLPKLLSGEISVANALERAIAQ